MIGRPYGRSTRPIDRRYGSARWKRTRLLVMRRDGWRCWVPGCRREATVCDHIDGVTTATTDAQFFDVSRLRCSCRAHNLARGQLGNVDEPQLGMMPRSARRDEPSAVITRNYTRRPIDAA